MSALAAWLRTLLDSGAARDWLDEVLALGLVAELREEDGEDGAAARDHFALAELGMAHERTRGLGATAAIAAAARGRRVVAKVAGEDARAAHGAFAIANDCFQAATIFGATHDVAVHDLVDLVLGRHRAGEREAVFALGEQARVAQVREQDLRLTQ